jgi:hypothetical protein
VSSNRFRVGFLAFPVVLLSACTGESATSPLDPNLCSPGDVGPGFQELTRGDFTGGDLARIGGGGAAPPAVTEGRFVFYKQTLPHPPFDPPLHVVCQVMEFADEPAAQAWIEALGPDESLAAAAVAWLPPENRHLREADARRTADGVFRAFEVTAGEGHTAMSAVFEIAQRDRHVTVLALGWNGRGPTGSLWDAADLIQARRATRLDRTD